jgi:hypothetical protein
MHWLLGWMKDHCDGKLQYVDEYLMPSSKWYEVRYKLALEHSGTIVATEVRMNINTKDFLLQCY